MAPGTPPGAKILSPARPETSPQQKLLFLSFWKLGLGELEVGLTFAANWYLLYADNRRIVLENPVDHSDLLKPGVYLLKWHGKVVFVGKTKCLLAIVCAHRAANSGPRLPEWFPIKRIQFDAFETIACATDRASLLLPALIDLYQPVHNLYSKPSQPFALHVPSTSEPRLTRRI